MNGAETSWWKRSSTGLIAVTLFAALVRLTYIDWDQHHFFHPDERRVAYAVGDISFKPLQLNPKFFAYGSLPIYLTKIASSLLSLIDPRLGSYDNVIETGRAVSGVIGTLTVLVVILLGMQLYDRSVGLLAGFLLAACVLHVQNSHFSTVDITLTFLVLLALYYLIGVVRRARTRDYIYAGLAIGFASATKASAFPLMLPLAVAAVYRLTAGDRFVPTALRVMAATLAVFVAFAIGQPYALLDFKAFTHDLFEQSYMVRNAGLFPYTNQYVGNVKYGYDLGQIIWIGMAPPLGLAAIWASGRRVIGVVHQRAEELVLLAWVVPFFLVTGWFEVKFIRYLLPIYPLMILWAAEWMLRIRRAPQARLLARLVLPGVVIGTLAALLAFLTIYTRPHTAVAGSEWLYKFIPAGSKIITQDWDEGFPLPLPGQNAERYKIVPFGYYEPDSPSKIHKLARELSDADYIAFQTKRLYGALTQAAQKFPLNSNYFYLLFSGDLGFTLIHEVSSRPSLFGLEFPDELVDESFTVYDHPKILIFHNDGHLTADAIYDKVMHGLPSQPLTRNDILLAHPGAEVGGGVNPPIQSSVPALLTFALIVEALGLAVYPLMRRWLPGASPYALSKVVGILFFAYVPWLLVSLHQVEFSRGTLAVVLLLMGGVGLLSWPRRSDTRLARSEWLTAEVMFWGVFLFFLTVRAFNPEVYWGEKPMDFSFLNALTRATTLPPPEPWFSGHDLNYSYFGYYITAALGKVCHIDPAITFNLGIALFGGLTAVAAVALGGVVGGSWRVGVVAACVTVLLGNLAGPREALIRHSLNFDYFWATSRVIRDTINEFPLWTFLFADLHAHAMVMPFSLAFLCLATVWVRERFGADAAVRSSPIALLIALGLTLGTITVTNTWSTFTFIPFFAFVLGCHWLALEGRGFGRFILQFFTRVLIPAATVALLAGAFFAPYWLHWTAPERNVGLEAANHARLQDFAQIFGLFLYVLVPFLFLVWRRLLQPPDRPRLGLWRTMLLGIVVLGVAAAAAISTRACLVILAMLALQSALQPRTPTRYRVPLVMASFAFFVTAGCDFIYVWDRMNTIFKFYLDSWFLFAAAAAAAAVELWRGDLFRGFGRRVWQAGLLALIAVALFTGATDTYGVLTTNRVETPRPSLNGMLYLQHRDAHELAAYTWLNERISGIPVILEAYGPSYQDFARVSMNTGLPTVLGWDYHVFQRANPWADINRRKSDIKLIYTSDNKEQVRSALERYHVALLYVGPLERRTYAGLNVEQLKSWSDLLTPMYENAAVTIFAVNGQFTGAIPVTTVEEVPRVAAEEAAPPPQEPEGQWHQPRGVAVDSTGAVYACDFGNNRIQKLKPDLSFDRSWGERGELPSQFKDPCGIAVGPKDYVFVADTWNHRVQVFTAAGQYVREFAAAFYGPRGVAVDKQGAVFVADTGNNRVARFSPNGELETSWGGVGKEAGKFAEPVGIAVGRDGNVYVCDNGNGRVQIFTRDGAAVSSFPVAGWESKVYSEPYIAIDQKGVIWVTVPLAKEVRAYDADGKLLRTITGQSVPTAKFDTPMGIAISAATKQIVIADLEHRIVRVPYVEAR